MSERSDYEPSLQREIEAQASIELSLREWDFAGSTTQENYAFAHGLIDQAFEGFSRLAHAGTELNFPPTELPMPLQGLYTHVWQNTAYIVGHPKIRLKKRGENITFPEKVNGQDFNEWLPEHATFDQALRGWKAAIEDPRNMYEPWQTIIDEAFFLSLEEGIAWGLEYTVEPQNISVAVWGEQGKTRQATEYALQSKQNPQELAATVAQLGGLAARYALKANS